MPGSGATVPSPACRCGPTEDLAQPSISLRLTRLLPRLRTRPRKLLLNGAWATQHLRSPLLQKGEVYCFCLASPKSSMRNTAKPPQQGLGHLNEGNSLQLHTSQKQIASYVALLGRPRCEVRLVARPNNCLSNRTTRSSAWRHRWSRRIWELSNENGRPAARVAIDRDFSFRCRSVFLHEFNIAPACSKAAGTVVMFLSDARVFVPEQCARKMRHITTSFGRGRCTGGAKQMR